MSESAIELYQAKLMVLHAAYLVEHGLPFTTEVSMAKHHVANTLWRVVDRAVQVHGALGYSKDSPLADMLLQARWSRFADGADEIHKWRVAEAVIGAFREHGTTRSATGDLPL
ncbi:MAG: acyl-CoA dehydrogenase family protein [Acidimicrobiales bacterium]